MGPVLALVGLMTLGQGIYYVDAALSDPPVPSSYFSELLIDPVWWGVIRISLGVVCVLSSIRPRQPVATLAVGGIVFVSTLWGLSYLIEAATGGPSLGWSRALPYLTITGLVLWGNWIVGRVRASADGVRPE